MNQYLVEINENNGAVINDDGKFSISKNSNEYGFEEILKKEDEIEELNNKNKANKVKLGSIKTLGSLSKTLDIFAFSLATLVSISLVMFDPLQALIAFLGSTSFTKALLVTAFGTKRGRRKEEERLETEILNTENEISNKEEELSNIKSKVNYKVTIDESKSIDIPTIKSVSSDKKVKIKQLGSKKYRN